MMIPLKLSRRVQVLWVAALLGALPLHTRATLLERLLTEEAMLELSEVPRPRSPSLILGPALSCSIRLVGGRAIGPSWTTAHGPPGA
jgi:hypothetical protein